MGGYVISGRHSYITKARFRQTTLHFLADKLFWLVREHYYDIIKWSYLLPGYRVIVLPGFLSIDWVRNLLLKNRFHCLVMSERNMNHKSSFSIRIDRSGLIPSEFLSRWYLCNLLAHSWQLFVKVLPVMIIAWSNNPEKRVERKCYIVLIICILQTCISRLAHL